MTSDIICLAYVLCCSTRLLWDNEHFQSCLRSLVFNLLESKTKLIPRTFILCLGDVLLHLFRLPIPEFGPGQYWHTNSALFSYSWEVN